MPDSMRIVVVRYRFIGDTVLTIPFLRALRRQYPTAHITMLVGADAYSLMAECPYLDEAQVFEPRQLGFFGAVKLLRAGGYDRAYLLKRSFSSALMTFLAGIPQRIGFDTEGRGWLLTQSVPYRSHIQHEAQCFLDLLGMDPITPEDLALEAWMPEAAQVSVTSLLADTPAKTRIVLHATSTNAAKTWPLPHFAALAESLAEAHPDVCFYALGTASEAAYYGQLASRLPAALQSRFVNLCGKTSLLESLAVLQQMDLVVANDSGMIHLAAAVGTPVVALFGPMDPVQWRPLSQNATVVTHPTLTCRPCRMKISCQHQYPCMTELTPDEVLAACKPFMTS